MSRPDVSTDESARPGGTGSLADRSARGDAGPGVVPHRADPAERARGPVPPPGGERRDAARHRRRLLRDARHPLGLRVPDRRRRRDRHRGRRGGLARRRGVRHLLRGAAARRRPRPRRSSAPRSTRSWTGSTGAIPRGVGRGGGLAARRPRELERCCTAAPGTPSSAGHGVRARPRPLRGRRRGAPTRTRRRSASGRWSAALGQVGSLGSGNHFLEVQAVDGGLRRATPPRRSGCAGARSA